MRVLESAKPSLPVTPTITMEESGRGGAPIVLPASTVQPEGGGMAVAAQAANGIGVALAMLFPLMVGRLL